MKELGGGKSFQELSNSERNEACKIRCKGHEKIFNHINSRQENLDILINLKEYFNSKGIKLSICIAPLSKEYRNCMSDKFKENIKDSTDLFKKYSDEYVDYNEYDFNNDDFVDPDHLNDIGAEKLSKLINYE